MSRYRSFGARRHGQQEIHRKATVKKAGSAARTAILTELCLLALWSIQMTRPLPVSADETTEARQNTVTVKVPASKRITRTGVMLKPGMIVRIQASGTVEAASAEEERAEYHHVPPGGRKDLQGSFPKTDVPALSLLGRIGRGPVHYVGAGGQFTLDERAGTGELLLGINDSDEHLKDNSGEWTVRITIVGDASSQPSQGKSGDAGTKPEASGWTKDTSGATAEVPASTNWTGLLVDASGLSVRRVMTPQVLDEQEKVIYPSPDRDADTPDEGWVSYLMSRTQAATSRAGKNPLIVKALRRTGTTEGAVVLSNDDVKRLREADAKCHFLDKMKVAFLLLDESSTPTQKTESTAKPPENATPTTSQDATTPTANPPTSAPQTPASTTSAEVKTDELVIKSVIGRSPPPSPTGDLQNVSLVGGKLSLRYSRFWQTSGDGESSVWLIAAKQSDLMVWVEWREADSSETLETRAEGVVARHRQQSERVERLANRAIAGSQAVQLAWSGRVDGNVEETLQIEWLEGNTLMRAMVSAPPAVWQKHGDQVLQLLASITKGHG